MSDDLVAQLNDLNRCIRCGCGACVSGYENHEHICSGDKGCVAPLEPKLRKAIILAGRAATALTEARAEIERLRGELADTKDDYLRRHNVAVDRFERVGQLESELSTLRDILVLCGELGGMGKDETPADYLRRLIEEVAGSETEREFARARVSELASENTNLRNDLVQRGMAEESLRARAEKAESALAEAVEVMRPFAKYLERLDCEWAHDNGEVGASINNGLRHAIKFGHLRAARRFIESQEPAEQEK